MLQKILSIFWLKACKSIAFLAFVFLFGYQNILGQELLCDVQLDPGGVQSVDKRVLNDMQRAIKEFMNNRRWTNDNFKIEERIKCTIKLTLSGTVGNYTAQAQILATRPIYGTGYETRLLNYLDKDWGFNYVEGQPLDFQMGNYTSNLTSLLAYYAYIIIGLDYDSFSKLGGKNYYAQAQQIGQNATQGGLKGWSQFDGTNTRYFLLENLQSQQFSAFRESIYEFYRKGFDVYADNQEPARPLLIDMLKKLKVAFDQRPTSILINIFLDMKADEFINIMKDATKPEQKQEAYNLLILMDPSKADKYQILIK